MKPIIYEQEINDGLSKYFESGLSLSYEIQVIVANKELYISKVKNVSSIVGNLLEDDFIYEYPCILATVGIWNLNDQIFDKFEAWKARYTPVNKPSNLNHNPSEVIGHTTRVFAITDEERPKVIPSEVDGKPNSDIPDIYHLLTVDSLYKYHINAYRKLTDENFATKLKDIYEKVVSGNLCVSMECIFSNFDYALMDDNGNQKVIERTDKSSFLSKKLKVFGGSGTHQNYRVGMIMRDIMFTGKGITDNPANPASVIFSKDSLAFATQNYTKIEDIETNENISAYITNVNGESKMNLEQLQAKVAELETELTSKKSELTAALEAGNTSESTIAGLNAQVASTTEKLTVAEKTLKETEDALKVAKAEVEAIKKTLSEKEDSLNAIKADKLKSDRLNSIKESLNISKEESEVHYRAVASLTDESFSEWLVNTAKVFESKKSEAVKLADELAEAKKELDKLNAAQASAQINNEETPNNELAVANTEVKKPAVRETVKALFSKN